MLLQNYQWFGVEIALDLMRPNASYNQSKLVILVATTVGGGWGGRIEEGSTRVKYGYDYHRVLLW
jgi:hypothetical protein